MNRPIPKLLVVLLCLFATATSCTRELTPLERAQLTAHLRDSLTPLIADSLHRRFGDSIDLVEELWRQRLVIERTPQRSMEEIWKAHVVWVPAAKVRDSASITSRVLETLHFGEEVTPVPQYGRIWGYESAQEWFFVKTISGKEGYIQNGDISTRSYYLGAGTNLLTGPVPCRQSMVCFQLMLMDHDHGTYRMVDTTVISRGIGEGGTYFHSRSFFNIALKGAPNLYWVESSNAACPEYHDQRLIAVLDSHIVEIAKHYIVGEWGWADYSKIYLPIRLENGRIAHIQGGEFDQTLSWEDLSLDTVMLPPGLKLPPSQTAIVVKGGYEDLEDENYHAVYDAQGHRKHKHKTETRSYLVWNGSGFVAR